MENQTTTTTQLLSPIEKAIAEALADRLCASDSQGTTDDAIDAIANAIDWTGAWDSDIGPMLDRLGDMLLEKYPPTYTVKVWGPNGTDILSSNFDGPNADINANTKWLETLIKRRSLAGNDASIYRVFLGHSVLLDSVTIKPEPEPHKILFIDKKDDKDDNRYTHLDIPAGIPRNLWIEYVCKTYSHLIEGLSPDKLSFIGMNEIMGRGVDLKIDTTPATSENQAPPKQKEEIWEVAFWDDETQEKDEAMTWKFKGETAGHYAVQLFQTLRKQYKIAVETDGQSAFPSTGQVKMLQIKQNGPNVEVNTFQVQHYCPHYGYDFDVLGYDANGFDREGYSREGINRNGLPAVEDPIELGLIAQAAQTSGLTFSQAKKRITDEQMHTMREEFLTPAVEAATAYLQ